MYTQTVITFEPSNGLSTGQKGFRLQIMTRDTWFLYLSENPLNSLMMRLSSFKDTVALQQMDTFGLCNQQQV